MSQFRCGNADDGYTMFPQPRISTVIALRSITHAVAYPVNFDREVCFRAIEIEHVRTHWMLAAENWLTRQPDAQSFP
jgi:hypothetical protein